MRQEGGISLSDTILCNTTANTLQPGQWLNLKYKQRDVEITQKLHFYALNPGKTSVGEALTSSLKQTGIRLGKTKKNPLTTATL